MKSLEVFAVQEMNAIEMKEQSGGWAWFERVANCAIQDVGAVVQKIVEVTLPRPTPFPPKPY